MLYKIPPPPLHSAQPATLPPFPSGLFALTLIENEST